LANIDYPTATTAWMAMMQWGRHPSGWSSYSRMYLHCYHYATEWM